MQENFRKDNKNIWFFTIFGLLILGSVGASFYRYYITKNYQIIAQVSCNINVEKCFQTACDSNTGTVCATTTDGNSVTYYKKISKRASNILVCENTIDKTDCKDELSCINGEKQCSYIYCSKDTLGDGEECATGTNI